MFRRVSAAIAAGREAAALSARPVPGPKSSADRSPPAGSGTRRPVCWALLHFGDARTLTARLAAHRAFCLHRGIDCLLVADDIPQICVTSREVRFEFLPWPARTALAIPGGHPAAVDHSYRRLGLILDFWQVVGCDLEGPRAEEFLDLAPSWAHPVMQAARAGRRSPSQGPQPVLALT